MTKISENAEKLLNKRYYLRDKNGNLLEHSWSDIARRVAKNVANAEIKDKEKWEETFYDKINKMEIIPSSPCLFNAGTKSQQLSSCFIVSIEDNIEGIFETVAECAKIFQMSGGVGFSMHKIRPKGSDCVSSGSKASGVISFMNIFNGVVNEVKQGNKRNGALKIDLPVDHPEIFDFIHCKDDTSELNNMNISVSLTNEFISAVENDLDWELKFNGKVYDVVKAKDLWNEIITSAWKTGEPGISYQDNMNNGNMNPHLGTDVFGNPCFTGDMRLLTSEGYKTFAELDGKAVELINVNGEKSKGKVWCSGVKNIIGLILSNNNIITCTPNHVFMLTDGTECEAKDLFEEQIKTYSGEVVKVDEIIELGETKVYDFNEPLTHWGIVEDCVVHNCHEFVNIPYSSCNLASINLTKIIENGEVLWDKLEENISNTIRFLDDMISVNKLPLPKIQEITEQIRPIGMGTMGLANLLYELKIPYDSKECIKFVDYLYHFIRAKALNTNIKLAKEKGVYPAWKGSQWREVVRCSSMLSIAPNGSIAFIANVPGGIEPEFALVYQRLDNEGDTYYVVNSVFEKYLKENNLYNDDILKRVINNHGSIKGLDDLFPRDIQRIFVVSSDISPEWHVDVLAAIQEYICLSISKTINMPHNATIEDVGNVYIKAGKLGIKGVTVYRDGCRENQVLSTTLIIKNDNDTIKPMPTELPRGMVCSVDDSLIGRKRKLITGCGSLHCQAFFDPITGDCMEVFLSKGSEGGCLSCTNAVSRLISGNLRGGVPTEYVIDQLNSIVACPSYLVRKATKKDTSKGSSCPNAVGYALQDMQKEIWDELGVLNDANDVNQNEIIATSTMKAIEDKCPECGEVLNRIEGCYTCTNCGFSRCS